MVSQVGINNASEKVFSTFKQPQNGWFLPAQTDNRDKKKSYRIPITIGSAALITGFGILALLKGPKGTNKYLAKLKTILEGKLEKGGKFQSFYKKSLDAINSFYQKSSSINNVNSLKDVLFQKLMFGKKFTKNIHQGITRFFNDISRNTVNASYAKTQRKFAKLNEYMAEINAEILTKDSAKADIVKTIRREITEMNSAFETGFGQNARNARLEKIEHETDELFSYFWGKSFGDIRRNFKSKDMYQTFIAEERMLPFKNAMTEDVSKLKEILTKELKDSLAKYKEILPEWKYKRVEKKANKLIKSLDKSIETETTSYIDKARDLKLGSAPTDIISILGTVGTVGWFLGKSKDKEERISSSLKYGIPAIGAIATSLLCTAKLVAGGKSIAIGLVSGWVMSKLGTVVDNTRKKYKLDVSIENRTIVKPQPDNV